MESQAFVSSLGPVAPSMYTRKLVTSWRYQPHCAVLRTQRSRARIHMKSEHGGNTEGSHKNVVNGVWKTVQVITLGVALSFASVFGGSVPVNTGLGVRPVQAAARDSKTQNSKTATKSDRAADEAKNGKKRTTMDPQTEGLASYGLAGLAFAGIAFSIFRKNRKEEDEEADRIKQEVERLEKWKKEFLDVEGEDGDDAEGESDLMASLKKRMGEVTSTDGKEGEGNDDESPSDSEADVEAIDRDMLKRMWDASSEGESTDEKNKKNKKK
mmetsp:Transcript_2783/g.4871  ORF Transcript_2783/g.4871 Transcript_2783/m.4871 type:complete len:269 (-) Transcript_2783:712-1518(-)|eukprot:CAMPEP_0184691390 /NCGR_PEP_ID=MMETSP0313-20130426/261_1 /TAXON_ID=2792 /ORGANISM="Porphyridium aerugineum, Strain SAG 1380-2" /LENGTH=268 /DNA_ID=CAMNT_0027149093 /DNA_START=163 /DNA_END=969 /DNA_ORIENTATION=+